MVRIVNRRERWAKWTMFALIALPVSYVASLGPACWIYGRTQKHTPCVFLPLERVFFQIGPTSHAMLWYAGAGLGPKDFVSLRPINADWRHSIQGGDPPVLNGYYVGPGNN